MFKPPSGTFRINPGQSVLDPGASDVGRSLVRPCRAASWGFVGVSEGWTSRIPSMGGEGVKSLVSGLRLT